MTSPRDMSELATWAAWEVIEGVTRGIPLQRVMYGVLVSAVNIMKEWPKA